MFCNTYATCIKEGNDYTRHEVMMTEVLYFAQQTFTCNERFIKLAYYATVYRVRWWKQTFNKVNRRLFLSSN